MLALIVGVASDALFSLSTWLVRVESVVVGVAVAHACADCWRLVWCLPAGLRPTGLRRASVLAGLPAGLPSASQELKISTGA